jgi:hypothetical protein
VACAAIIGGNNNSSTSNQSSSSSSSSSSGNSASQNKSQDKGTPTAKLNEEVKVGDATWVVIKATQETQLRNRFGGAPKNGNFIMVDFGFRNDGNEAKTLHAGALQLVDSAGRTSDPATDTFGYIPNELNIFLTQVNPGVIQPAEVIFSVAAGGSGYKLLLKDTNLFKSSKNQAYVDLGL